MRWWRRRDRERDLERELRSDLESEAAEQQEKGVSPDEARYAARRALGNATLIKEEVRGMWGWTSIDRFAQDVRYALRGMRKSPGFTLTAVLSLALGIGANTAIFSLIDALLLRWLPVHDPQHLVEVMIFQNGKRIDSFSYPVVRALADQKDIFSELCGFSGALFNVGPRDAVERVAGAWVSGAYYETLGLQPQIGRLISREDDEPGAAPVAVIADEYWQLKFGRDPKTIGRAIPIEGVPVTIVGVSAPGFTGANVGQVADITLPLAANTQLFPEMTGRLSAGSEWLRILARPQPGISLSQAKARLAVVWPQLANVAVTPRTPPARRKALLSSTLDVIPGATGWTNLRNQFRRPLMVLMTLVGLVLLIACANVANLLLARAQARQQEIAVRLAIGASRARLIRQLLTESVLLASLGGIVAIVFAWFASRLLVELLSTWRGAIMVDLTPDWRVFGFTAALAFGTGIIFGVAPALRATAASPSLTLKRATGTRTRLASFLVAVQIAISFVLLIGAGLFVRTLENLDHIDPGFRHEGVLLIEGDLHRAVNAARIPFYRDVLQQIEASPGVTSSSLASNTPLSGGWWTEPVAINEQPSSGESAHFNSIAPRYFETMRTPLVMGRDFNDRDDANGPPVAIVNEAFVERYFPDGHPLGQHVSSAAGRDPAGGQIVGVVKDTISQSLRDAPPPAVYVPIFQRQTEFPIFVVRASGSLAQVASNLRNALQPKLPGVAIQVHTLTAQVEAALVQERLMATLAAAFGVLALILAAIGLYGLLAYTVARRTNELGIRMALGANRRQVMWLVIQDAIGLLALGAIAGLPAAWAASRLITAMLFGLTATDPVTIFGASAILIAVGLLAGYLPARRASRVDPMVALRYE
jgi:putative ABC transport system permease protein